MDSAILAEVQEVFDADILAAFLSLTPELAKPVDQEVALALLEKKISYDFAMSLIEGMIESPEQHPGLPDLVKSHLTVKLLLNHTKEIDDTKERMN